MKRTTFYTLFSAISLAGYGWAVVNWLLPAKNGPALHACLFRSVTGIPCPSCGGTRSVFLILHGELGPAFLMNPLGFLLLPALIILPAWIVWDCSFKKSSLYQGYIKAENVLRSTYVAWSLIIMVVSNWIWNIIKFT